MPTGEVTTTTVAIPFVRLPKKPGRNRAGASAGPHRDRARAAARSWSARSRTRSSSKIRSRTLPNAKPSRKPAAAPAARGVDRRQTCAIGGAIALVAARPRWLFVAGCEAPRPAPPPPPARPPWEVALEELSTIRYAGLDQGGYAEHFDRVSDAMRKYLGDRVRLRRPGEHHARDTRSQAQGPPPSPSSRPIEEFLANATW